MANVFEKLYGSLNRHKNVTGVLKTNFVVKYAHLPQYAWPCFIRLAWSNIQFNHIKMTYDKKKNQYQLIEVPLVTLKLSKRTNLNFSHWIKSYFLQKGRFIHHSQSIPNTASSAKNLHSSYSNSLLLYCLCPKRNLFMYPSTTLIIEFELPHFLKAEPLNLNVYH